MYLVRSAGRKAVATAAAAACFAFWYQATALDSRDTAPPTEPPPAVPTAPPESSLRFRATAYCRGTTTASGVNVRTGIAAADPALLPVGSVIALDRLEDRYNGIYTVMDTGPKVKGRHVDLYMWSCNEARQFGRRPVAVSVLRLGWDPGSSTPPLIAPLSAQGGDVPLRLIARPEPVERSP